VIHAAKVASAVAGCCIYDEGCRHPSGRHGVLNWLIAGNDALMLSCLDDERLLHMVLDSLPEMLAEGRGLAIEARVHRWPGAINGLPGGNPVLSLHERHQPDPVQFPGLYVVGDYLFDSTLNGVYDSADYVSDLILTRLRKLKYLGEDQPAPLREQRPEDHRRLRKRPANKRVLAQDPSADSIAMIRWEGYDGHRTRI
jgi:hypothetical protein